MNIYMCVCGRNNRYINKRNNRYKSYKRDNVCYRNNRIIDIKDIINVFNHYCSYIIVVIDIVLLVF